MNILLVSDDHGFAGFETAFNNAVREYGQIHAVLHAGDTQKDNEDYYNDICDGVLFVSVRGNNDFNDAPMERKLKLGGKSILLTHGHRYNVYFGIQSICSAAMEKQCDIVVYGHTHQRNHQKGEDLEVINPGSLTGIRSSLRSYAVLVIDDDGSTKVNFHEY